MGIDTTIGDLMETHRLREPVLRNALRALGLPPGSRGLDAGCGIGLQALMLAEAIAPGGHVTGLDLAPEMIARAEEIAAKACVADHVDFRRGDVRDLPFNDDTFDWAWSVDCVGYAPMEPLPLVQELARVVRPDGTVVILAWSSQQLLPGYPGLEARLNATRAGVAPFVEGKSPDLHFLRALGWFRDTGLENPTARTFAGSVHAPLTSEIRRALDSLIRMRWSGSVAELSPEDREAYEGLVDPASAAFILDHSDYCAFFTYTMFSGNV